MSSPHRPDEGSDCSAPDTYESGLYDYVMGSGPVAGQWQRIHRAMERPYDGRSYRRILEVGGGRGEHLGQVRSQFGEYVLTDKRADRLPSPASLPSSVTCRAEDLQALSFDDHAFDRVVATCVLAHVPDPVVALREIHRVLAPGGDACIYIPCEPGIALRLARRVWTVPRNRAFGVADPYYLHFREHVHYYGALNHYLRREFAGSRIRSRSFPFPGLSWNANLYRLYWITAS